MSMEENESPTRSPESGPSASVCFRPGRFIEIPLLAPWWERQRALHDARLRDTIERSESAVAVLQSAVLLHGGMLKRIPDQAHVRTSWHRKPLKHDGPDFFALAPRERRERLAKRTVVNHRMEIDKERLVTIDGITTTDLFQTMGMCARFLPVDEAFVALESLLAKAVGREDDWRADRRLIEAEAARVLQVLRADLDGRAGQRGVQQARELFGVIGPLSESPMESEARRIALAAGYSRVESQIEVRTSRGTKWVDLGIRGLRRGLEINGDVKYEGEAGDLRRAEEALRREALDDAGFTIVDIAAHDVLDPRIVLASLHQCFAEQRDLRGRAILWTPSERRRYLS